MNDGFYKAFEEKFRGPRELIKKRLSIYLPIVDALYQLYDPFTAVDLGCGRGEWLEILNEKGVKVKGVDLDEGMLALCREKGLDVINGDAISFLKGLPDESEVLVSAFHLIEHLQFDELQELVKETLRVLKKGGMLIMETPNPENIRVGTLSFYLDPTHQNPIPPQLLSFLPEYYGFERTKILRLQERKELISSENITFLNVIAEVSPDYSAISQKSADEGLLEKTDDLFQKEYGLTLETLAQKYDRRILDRLEHSENLVRQAELYARQLHDQLNNVYASASWRITRPLRKTRDFIVRLPELTKKICTSMIITVMRCFLACYWIRHRIDSLLVRFPWLRRKLYQVAESAGLLDSSQNSFQSDYLLRQGIYLDLENMNANAKRVYFDLQRAIKQRKQKGI